MVKEKIITTKSFEELLQKAEEDLLKNTGDGYHITLVCNERRILLDISTISVVISAYLYNRNEFRFSLYKQGTLDELGKFFGMQDVVLGYKEFDETFIIKSNNEPKVATLFIDGLVRNTLINHSNLTLGIVEYILENADGKAPFLELRVNSSVNNTSSIKNLLTAFYTILEIVEK